MAPSFYQSLSIFLPEPNLRFSDLQEEEDLAAGVGRSRMAGPPQPQYSDDEDDYEDDEEEVTGSTSASSR